MYPGIGDDGFLLVILLAISGGSLLLIFALKLIGVQVQKKHSKAWGIGVGATTLLLLLNSVQTLWAGVFAVIISIIVKYAFEMMVEENGT